MGVILEPGSDLIKAANFVAKAPNDFFKNRLSSEIYF